MFKRLPLLGVAFLLSLIPMSACVGSEAQVRALPINSSEGQNQQPEFGEATQEGDAASSWTLSGRIELIDDENFDLPQWFPVEGFRGTLAHESPLKGEELEDWKRWADPDDKPVRETTFSFEILPSGDFSVAPNERLTEHLNESPATEGSWSLTLNGFDHPRLPWGGTGYGVFVDSLVATSLKVAVKDKHCGFGSIKVGYDALFEDQHLLFGRLLDSERRPLARSWTMQLVNIGDDYGFVAGIETDGKGRFLACVSEQYAHLSDEALRSRLGLQHLTRLRPVLEAFDPAYDVLPLPAPKVTGKVWHFGDVALRGGVIRVRVKDNRPSAGTERERLDAYAGQAGSTRFYLECASYLSNPSLVLPESGEEACAWVPAGIYLYRTYLWNPAYQETVGTITVPNEGAVTVEIPVDPEPFVAVQVESGDSELERIDVLWKIFMGGEQVRDGRSNSPKFAVVLHGEEHAVLSFRTGTNHIVEYELRSGERHRKIELPSEPKHGWIRIKYPQPPEGIEGYLNGASLRIEGSHRSLHETWLKDGKNRYRINYIGEVAVSLWAGWNYTAGWADHATSGPVKVQVRPGETADIELPPLVGPFWKHRAGGVEPVEIYCGRTRISAINAPGRNRDGTPTRISVSPLDPSSPSVPHKVEDGMDSVPVLLSPPQSDGDKVRQRLELPERVRVDLSALAEFFGQQLIVRLKSRSTKHTSCEVRAEGEAVSLWAPPGRAKLEVRLRPFDLPVYVAELNLKVGATLQHAAKYDDNARKVAFRASSLETPDDGGNWQIFSGDTGSNMKHLADLHTGEARALLPGRYLAVSGRWGDRRRSFEFEVVNEKDQVVELPPIGPEPNRCMLRIHFPLPEGEYLGSSLSSVPVRGNAAFKKSRYFQDYSTVYLDTSHAHRIHADGMTVFWFPRDVDHLLYGQVSVRTGSGVQTWLLAPTVVRATSSLHEHAVKLQRGVQLQAPWKSMMQTCSWHEDFLLSPYADFLPEGTHSLEITFEDGKRFSWNGTVSAEDATAAIPESTERELRAHYRDLVGQEPD